MIALTIVEIIACVFVFGIGIIYLIAGIKNLKERRKISIVKEYCRDMIGAFARSEREDKQAVVDTYEDVIEAIEKICES